MDIQALLSAGTVVLWPFIIAISLFLWVFLTKEV